MKSTWRAKPREDWNLNHWQIALLDFFCTPSDKTVPLHSKNERIPYVNQWSGNIWVLFYASIPLCLHQLYALHIGSNLGPYAVFIFYSLSYGSILLYLLCLTSRLGCIYGFLDGDKHERDGVPDIGVGKVVASFYKTCAFRLVFSTYLSYDPNKTPVQMSWTWLLLEVSLYGLVSDFWFYCYHRLMHEVSFFWKYHRTHHLTKHPNGLLSVYADHEQEFLDLVGVEIATYLTLQVMGLPMGFFEWWICLVYALVTEVGGHTGLRIHMIAPSPVSWLWQWLGVELVMEDHDLHHRTGWRKSHNYGKQTRFWDHIFGTCADRIESAPGNVDYSTPVHFPLFDLDYALDVYLSIWMVCADLCFI